jgi:tetratricopeptide (TPR) repeat protein
MIEESLALYKSLENKLGQATALDWLSIDHHDPECAKAYLVESLRLYREVGHLSGIAMCLADLATVLFEGGDFSSLKPLLEEAYTLYRQLGNRTGEAWIMTIYGMLASWEGEHQQAYPYFEQAITLYEKVGVSLSDWTRVQMAHAFLRQGDIVQARETFQLILQHFQTYDSVIGLVFTIEGFASWQVTQGQTERAARLFAWADASREKIYNNPRPLIEQKSVDRDVAIIHSKLKDADFAKFSEEGRAMTVEQAIALALETSE